MSAVGVIVLIFVFAVLAIVIATQLIGSSAEAAVPRTGKMTAVKGGKIHWIEAGEGKPVVMIHGLGGNLRNFTYALTDKLEGEFRVIALDRPGCGWSLRDGPEQATLPEQARMIAEFIETEGLEKPVIVGHSLGGAIGEMLALNHPDQVGALALICPATNEVKQTPDAFKGIDIPVPALIPILGNSIAGVLSLVLEKKIYEQVFAPEPVSADFAVRGGAKLGRRPEAFIAAAQDLAQSRATVSAALGREGELSMPVGVLYGAKDQILDPELHGKTFAEAAGATYAELPDRGHMIPLTAPNDCADFIREMAAKV